MRKFVGITLVLLWLLSSWRRNFGESRHGVAVWQSFCHVKVILGSIYGNCDRNFTGCLNLVLLWKFCSLKDTVFIFFMLLIMPLLFRTKASPSKSTNFLKFLIKFKSLPKFPQNYHTDIKSNNTSAFIFPHSLLNASKEFIYYFSSGIISPFAWRAVKRVCFLYFSCGEKCNIGLGIY